MDKRRFCRCFVLTKGCFGSLRAHFLETKCCKNQVKFDISIHLNFDDGRGGGSQHVNCTQIVKFLEEILKKLGLHDKVHIQLFFKNHMDHGY